MEQFQCFECGMISNDQVKVSNHMRTSHNIKVEVDLLSRKFPCSLCKFTTRNMEELKGHLINDHNKEEHNWMVEEIEAQFVCDECDMKFPRKSVLEEHLNETHSGDRGGIATSSQLEWSCISCQKLFRSESESQEHFNSEHCKNDSEVDGDLRKEESISHQEVKSGHFEMELIPKNSSNENHTGVIFRGESEEFEEAQRTLEKILQKPNFQFIIDGREVRIKNVPRITKTSPTTIEITTKKGEVGCAGIQFFSSKTSSIMITKQSRYEIIMVKALAFKIIKPLLNGLVSGDLNEESIMKLEKKPFDKTIGKFKPSDCTQCGKTFVNSHGVSVHMAKIHERKCAGCQNTFQTTNELKVHEEVCKLKTPISKMKQERKTESTSKEETKPVSLQRKTFNCENCKFKGISVHSLESHIQIEHEENVSPDPKRYKAEQELPVEDTLQILKSLTVGGEEDMAVTEIDTQKKRKREVLQNLNSNENTAKETTEVLETHKKDNLVENETCKKDNLVEKDPNLRSLPDEVKKILGDDNREYIVKGDGPCLLRTTAAHIEGDEDKGIEMARNLNTHLALNRELYKEKLSSIDFPMEVTIGVKGQTKSFSNSDEYFDWLQEAKEAAYMWRGCIDVMAICNMAQMDIDIIIHEKGHKAQLRSFEPDPKFPWKEEDPMKPTDINKRKQGKMTVLNWKDLHFNLIVNREHMLFQLGSFKFQEKNSELTENSSKTDKEITPVKEDHETCQKTIRNKDFEINKLKEKVKILTEKLLNKVDDKHNKSNTSYDNRDMEELDSEAAFIRKEGFARSNPQESAIPVWKCKKCEIILKTKDGLNTHMLTHEKNSNICEICDGKFSSKSNLDRHMRSGHRT